MDVAFSSWFVILLAVIAANLPFLNERLFMLFTMRWPDNPPLKPFWVRLIELLILYCAVGGMAYLLEARIGSVFPQKWEFFAVTGCLFIVLAFPGFVFRYLYKRHG